MVRLTKNRSYTVHGRSLDRSNDLDTPSNFTLTLNDAIQTMHAGQYMKASLLSCTIPSSFYQIDTQNRTIVFGFNRPTFNVLKPDLDVAVNSPEDGKPTRRDYEREVTVSIQKGNYDIESLLVEIVRKLNAACAVAHAAENFRAFIRMGSGFAAEDFDDCGGIGIANHQIIVCPVFAWQYNKQLNKVKIYRIDAGGLVAGGKFDLQTTGRKLSFAIGCSHVTAQLIARLRVSANVQTTVENSLHYRETTLTEFNDFEIGTLSNGGAYGHAFYSANSVNMFFNDEVYFRTNLPPNGMETLSGGTSNILCIIPMTSGASAQNFYIPTSPTSTTIDGAGSVSQLAIRLTDATGELIEFQGGEVSFSILFECFDKNTYSDKPADPNYVQNNEANRFSNVHRSSMARHPAHLLV